MIDIENDVFDYVAKAVRAAHSGVTVTGEYAESFAKFPAVTIVEADNRVSSDRRSSESLENAADLMYELNIYSNRASGRKTEAKAIADTADGAMQSLGFKRDFRQQVPNLKDATIYRIVCRYSGRAIPDEDGRIYIHAS